MDFTFYYRNVAVYSFFNLLFGLYSHLLKERLFLSESLVSLLFGILCGPVGLNWILPSGNGSSGFDIWLFFYQFARIVMAFQTMAAGIYLPKGYLVKKAHALAILLGPVMLAMWLTSSLLIKLLFPQEFHWLEALVMGACVTPTDPVLASSIVKGKFAEEHIPQHVRDLLSAESGANDGAALPLLFLPLLILKRDSLLSALQEWILNILIYRVILSIIIGSSFGYLARRLLKYSEFRGYIDKESLLVYSLAMALFLTATVTIIGSNDMLAVFMAGAVFAWDDWFVEQTRESQLQQVVDSVFNSTFFVLFGAAIPWAQYKQLGWIRLTGLAALILLLRRLPWVYLLTQSSSAEPQQQQQQLKNPKERVFAGWFGPIGVGALFYATLASMEWKHDWFITVASFIVMTSVLIHAITVPIFQLTLTRQLTLSIDYLRAEYWHLEGINVPS